MTWMDGALLLMKRNVDGTSSRLGTGFFIALDGTFMTAAHVVGTGEGVFAVLPDGAAFYIDDVRQSPKLDIAVARVQLSKGLGAFPLSVGQEPEGTDVKTAEFSYTEGKDEKVWRSVRKGNIVAAYPWRTPLSAEAMFLELSFPAPVGSSGAPVVVEATGVVAGMILGHVDREHRGAYSIPMGMAISSPHLLDFARAEGMELKLYMTMALSEILKTAEGRLNAALLEAARDRAGVDHIARVETCVPQEVTATLEEPEAPGHEHRLPFTLTVLAGVAGCHGPPMTPGTYWRSVSLRARIRGTLRADTFDGRLIGTPSVWIEGIEVLD